MERHHSVWIQLAFKIFERVGLWTIIWNLVLCFHGVLTDVHSVRLSDLKYEKISCLGAETQAPD